MKMDDMNKWLELRGFNVLRTYHNSVYTFTISLGNDMLTGQFTYNPDISDTARNKEQREFLTHLVDTFYVTFPFTIVSPSTFAIKKVIFNDPATIILWMDGTKTVVKCSENDTYSPEMGMAMAICKKALGNKGNYSKVFKKWLPKEEACESQYPLTFAEAVENFKRFVYAAFGLEEDDG